ncbi:phenylalanine--tRNA ligase subunit beta [Brevirhabdus pacifica]|uniref:Phenylalanine--tRNA ligase beta subunit n=1 Tax=Brevirhabdus pacifica TaxID=1267768 RepID=A0A1U7DHR2_9RHOB|nr:phenylalanine--tRNA ligase subunit beta [Brevirhabdus pacifica]APX89534.1 phenylalanine--tRNA ligase subunit beta [Brevirhabdus pacifica]OWU76460.1 phenylalanyl-tRNA synthetase subunit beta [Loktanella sp. 22II-4b]PJJ85809.1 phenylalanyl-tRNA synthetase beta subunit [Brevirhabdus pacifica]
MKFTVSWLGDHLETDASVDEICDTLTDLGLEVEGVENPADTLGAFRICRVIEAGPHPDADRLRLCRVETWPQGPDGPTEEVQVVCGAPNARTGLVGVFAPVGTHVPGTGVDLKPGVIRGVESNGMLCSERELMLSDNHDGIIDLPEDAPLGERFIDYRGVNDPVIEIAITPNRPDALGVRGIARDLAARGLGRLKDAPAVSVASGGPSPINVSIDDDVLADGACPVFCGRMIRGVRNGPSPEWMQKRLRAIGLRPISALVDVTNFLTYDRNRPLHVFDVDKVQGDLRVHYAKGGERLVALDDKEYELGAGMMVISDDQGVESIAGIMGGAPTGCTEETVNVFVESAYWNPVAIAHAGRALKINSDARYRFERGIDPAFTPEGLDIATALILEICGGEASEVVCAGAVPDTDRAYRLDTDRVQSLVGMDIPADTQRQTLTALGFRLEGDMAHVPSWRPDVMGQADLVEEVARIASLTRLEGRPMPRVPGVPRPILTPLQRRESAARRAGAALGYNECVTYSFIDQPTAAMFGGGDFATMLENPISSDMSHMRPSLLPGLLQAAARNQARGFTDLALFEVGPVFEGGEPEDQRLQMSGLLVGHNSPREPHGGRRPVDIYDAKADAEAVLAELGAPAKVQIARGAEEWWHPGRHGVMRLGPKKVLAVFGELHPKVLNALDIKGPAVAFTIWPSEVPVPKAKGATRPALEMRDLQAVERDFAFVVDEGVEALGLVNAAAGANKALIEDVRVFDEFTGDKARTQMGEGKKSLAITVRLQPRDKTLTEADIEAVSAKIVEKVAKATGGTLRG